MNENENNNERFRYAVTATGGNFSSRIEVNGKDVQITAAKGIVEVDAAAAAVIDEFCALEGHSFGRMLQKIDIETARIQAAQWLAAQRPAAANGAFTSESAGRLQALASSGSNKLLGDVAPNNPAALAEFSQGLLGDHLALTENVDVNALEILSDGVDADVPASEAVATAGGGVRLNLGGGSK